MRSPGLLTSSLVRGLMVVGMYSTFFIGVLYFQHVLGYDPVVTGSGLPAPDADGGGHVHRDHRPHHEQARAQTHGARAAWPWWPSGWRCSSRPAPHGLLPPDLRGGAADRLRGGQRRSRPLLTIALAGVPAQDAGIGSGIVNVSQQVSGVLSVAILGAVSASHTASLLGSGSSAVDALDGGYRPGVHRGPGQCPGGDRPRILHPPAKPARQPETAPAVDETFEAESETMIAEIM